MTTWTVWLGVAAAGAIGAPCRYLLDGVIRARTEGAFPWGTLVVNITGSLLLGLITGAALYHSFPATPRIWLASGFCGAYTTFSTFAFETIQRLEARALTDAARNAAFSLVGTIAAAGLGLALAARL